MAADESKAIIRRLFETVWNGKNLDALDDYFAAEYTLNGEPFSPEKTRQVWRGMFSDTPDLHLTIEDMIADGVAVYALRPQTVNTLSCYGGLRK